MGILRVARYPMLWSFALWAATHVAIHGTLGAAMFTGEFLVVAVAGISSLDAKYAKRAPDIAWAVVDECFHRRVLRSRNGGGSPGVQTAGTDRLVLTATTRGCSGADSRASRWAAADQRAGNLDDAFVKTAATRGERRERCRHARRVDPGWQTEISPVLGCNRLRGSLVHMSIRIWPGVCRLLSLEGLGRWRIAGLGVVFVWFFVGGIAHFAATATEMRIVPPWIAWPRAAVLVSGAFELLGAVGLLWQPTRRAAGIGLFLLTLAVTPAHIYMLQRPELFGVPYWALVLRLPVQVALLALIAWSTASQGTATRHVGRR